MSGAGGAGAGFAPLRNWAQSMALNYKRILRNRRRRIKQTKYPIKHWHIVRGDTVEILQGKDRGKQGKVTKVDRKRHRLFIEGAFMNYRIAAPSETQPGGMYKAEAPIHYSNVNLVDPVTKRPTRVAIRFQDDGRKVRVAKRSGSVIQYPDMIKERSRPRPTETSYLDTDPKDATEKTFPGLEVEYENLQKLRRQRRERLLENRGLLHKYEDPELQHPLRQSELWAREQEQHLDAMGER
eukprot:gb/GECG01001444.1/.p1 GENE.gb/GECG01001444.1/~~gb/GECG01001444.1/.p1  ORF type:complete len:239 (+),score=27.81 gb/GECG01001444.1/:1-717(+)